MSKDMKKMIVPKLRFPEFRGVGDWGEPSLAEICERITEKVGDKKLTTVSITAGTGFVSQAEKFSRDISGNQYKNYILLSKGDYSYNKGNSKRFPQGCIYKLKEFEQVAAPSIFISFRFKNDYCGNFFQGYFDSNRHGEQLKKFISSGARSDGLININADDFFSIMFPAPKYPEQQKIASCLSSIDELIAAQSQKVDALKTHKKALMQQLFPTDGEIVPSLRFPEFRDAGAWEEKTLREVSDLITKGTTPKKFSENGIRFIKIESFYENHIALERCAYIDEEIHNNELKRSRLQSKDILFAIAGATIGKVNLVTENLLPANTNQALAIIRPKEKENVNLILSILRSEIMNEYIKKSISVGAQPNLNLEQIGNFCFKYPVDIYEQQKIASCLSSIDELIAAQSQKVEALKTHKKGLMQQLFPVADEVKP